MSEIFLNFSAKKITKIFIIITLILVVLSTIGNFFIIVLGWDSLSELVRIFNLDSELNIPTWFATTLLLFASVLLAIIAQFKITTKDAFSRHWLALAIIFLFLSIDEAASIHEIIGYYFGKIFGGGDLAYFSWVIPGIIFVVVLVFIFWKFLLHLPNHIRRLMLIAAIVFIGGAVGFEILGGLWVHYYDWHSMAYVALFTIEEAMEKIGLIIFIYALFSYLKESKINLESKIT